MHCGQSLARLGWHSWAITLASGGALVSLAHLPMLASPPLPAPPHAAAGRRARRAIGGTRGPRQLAAWKGQPELCGLLHVRLCASQGPGAARRPAGVAPAAVHVERVCSRPEGSPPWRGRRCSAGGVERKTDGMLDNSSCLAQLSTCPRLGVRRKRRATPALRLGVHRRGNSDRRPQQAPLTKATPHLALPLLYHKHPFTNATWVASDFCAVTKIRGEGALCQYANQSVF